VSGWRKKQIAEIIGEDMTMPAGKYYVGDLCYVMHECWDEVCGLFFKGRTDGGCNEGEFNLKDGRRFVSYNTKWGDGGYYDESGNEYSVDAGLIGCICLDDIDFTNDENNINGGHVIEFRTDFDHGGGRSNLGRNWDGVIRIGHVKIITD
jgi:predicted enzyme related to lactoylglutathione lyase